jgi:hypothetical protein
LRLTTTQEMLRNTPAKEGFDNPDGIARTSSTFQCCSRTQKLSDRGEIKPVTAEVAILNTAAVALATDSAVTLGSGGKVYNSASKLFALSKYHPVGIMFFNNAALLGVPWESTIKIYRERLGSTSFPHLNDYFQHFLDFIRSAEDLFPRAEQEKELRNTLGRFFTRLRKEIDEAVKQGFEKNPQMPRRNVQRILANTIRAHYTEWRQLPTLTDWSARKMALFSQEIEPIFSEVKDRVFQHHDFSPAALRHLRQLAAMLF